MLALDRALAERYAAAALDNVRRPYPCAPGHVLAGPSDLLSHRELHPAFYGSFDWHSSVHQHWLLVRLLTRFPALDCADAIRATLDRHLTVFNIDAEVAYLREPLRRSWERPYGWGWLLTLAAELRHAPDPAIASHAESLTPLVETIGELLLAWMPTVHHPVRHGVHSNSAFGVLLARVAGTRLGDEELVAACDEAARRWFLGDRDHPTVLEPSGEDFLSPALTEAHLATEVIGEDFPTWFDAFLPRWRHGSASTITEPVTVSDPSDLRMVHLHGLNLSRAWSWRRVAAGLAAGDEGVSLAMDTADRHLEASADAVLGTGYGGDHWLATFAVLALDGL